MEIWEMVGLWHYPIPGFFLLAQFCLGILIALGNLVNNTVFLCVSDEEWQSSNNNYTEEGRCQISWCFFRLWQRYWKSILLCFIHFKAFSFSINRYLWHLLPLYKTLGNFVAWSPNHFPFILLPCNHTFDRLMVKLNTRYMLFFCI